MLRSFNHTLPIEILPQPSGDANVDIQHLSIFLSSIARPQIDPNFLKQTYACVGIISFLELVSASMILHRLVFGRAWVLKLWHVAGGTFVIPNAVIGFLLCMGLFGMTWIAFAITTIQHYRDHAFQQTYFIIKALTWCPLWWGGWWTTFGLASAFPDALTYQAKGSKQRRLILRPTVFNLACWGGPIVQMLSLLPMAIPGGRGYATAAARYDLWADDVKVALETVLDVSGAEELHTRAMEIWLEFTRIYWWYSAMMTVWCGWAILMLLIYGPVGGHVLVRIRRQVKVEEAKKRRAVEHTAAGDLEAGFADAIKGGDKQEEQIRTNISTSRVFPPLRESSSTDQKSSQPHKTPQERRLNNLKRLLINLSVQYCGVMSAIMLFFSSSGIDAFGVYDAARYNHIMRIEDQTNLLAFWTMVLFASLIFLCIFQRSFDPSLSVDLSEEGSPPVARRSALSGFLKPFLDRVGRGGKVTTKNPSVNSDDAASEDSASKVAQARPQSVYLIRRLSTVSTLAVARSDDEKPKLTFSSQKTAPQALTIVISPLANDSTSSGDTIEMWPTDFPFKSPPSTRSVFSASSPHVVDPAMMECYEELKRTSSRSDSMISSELLHKPSVTSLKQPEKAASRSTLRRPTTAPGRHSAARLSLTEDLPLLDMEAKCFIPPGSKVEPESVAKDESRTRSRSHTFQG